jgi:hypothetical protein
MNKLGKMFVLIGISFLVIGSVGAKQCVDSLKPNCGVADCGHADCNSGTGVWYCDYDDNGDSCTDGNKCTLSDKCDGAGQCVPGPLKVCDDLNFCNGVETCSQSDGQCKSGTPVVCDDGKYCNGVETCDETIDGCAKGKKVNCPDDGNVCNGPEYCDNKAAGCVSGPAVVCDDIPCDSCDTGTGECYSIEPGYEMCNGACVNTMSDNENCGECGNVCGSLQNCAKGKCTEISKNPRDYREGDRRN